MKVLRRNIKIFFFLVVIVLLVMISSPIISQYASAHADVTITVRGVMGAEGIQPVLDEFFNQTGITADYTQDITLSDYLLNCKALGNCPDLAVVPNVALFKPLADQGAIQPLDPILTDFDLYYGATWRELGSVDGILYGLPLEATLKSIVWYRPDGLTSIGEGPPGSWGELLSLADTFVLDSQTPFSIGAESGAASGWPLTDIFENILVRVAGPDAHRNLVNYTISWTDPAVAQALQHFTDIIGQETYIDNGTSGILTTNFIDAFYRVFAEPSYANLHFGATWMLSLFDPSAVPLTDYDYFLFPEINPGYGKPMIGGGDFVVLFSDQAAAQSLAQFLAEPETGEIWVTSVEGHISPNMGVNLDLYTNPILKDIAEEVVYADDFLFDLDDQLPSELQTYIFGAMMDFVANQDEIPRILTGIQLKALQVQGLAYSVFMPQINKQ